MAKNIINNRPYFEKFTCSVCKKPASFYRFAKGKQYYICGDKKCDYVNLINLGYIKYLVLPTEK